jgi:hypothetical protein
MVDEYWREYNDNGNVIHLKDSDGYEYWRNMMKMEIIFIIKIQLDMKNGINMMSIIIIYFI